MSTTLLTQTGAPTLAVEQINRPESERGSRARLRSIRQDSGYRSESDIY